jgi:ankyrin repeat-rich membrane spanning protein
LHWAIDKNHTAIVRLLLTSNPDLEAKTVDGDTPLLRAVRQRNAVVVSFLFVVEGGG